MVQTDDRDAEVAHARRAAASFAPPPGDSPVAWLRRFTGRYGWRAYALPVLVVITVLALLSTGGGSGSSGPSQAVDQQTQQQGGGQDGADQPSAPPVASGNTSLKQDQAGADANNDVLASAALPPGPAYTSKGQGTFRILKGSGPRVGKGDKLYRYSIDVENGVTGVDLTAYADEVQTVLSDTRSWAGHDGVSLQRVDSGHIDFHVTLTSALTVRKYCGYEIHVETSCYTSVPGADPTNRVFMNVSRWVRGAMAYVGDVDTYRIYMINHEDGHALGHNHAHQCLPNGAAPAMMQQTIGLRSAATGQLCTANPWPYPPGVEGTPGAEQLDTAQNSEFGLTGD